MAQQFLWHGIVGESGVYYFCKVSLKVFLSGGYGATEYAQGPRTLCSILGFDIVQGVSYGSLVWALRASL